jgi:hypothetical protein
MKSAADIAVSADPPLQPIWVRVVISLQMAIEDFTLLDAIGEGTSGQ